MRCRDGVQVLFLENYVSRASKRRCNSTPKASNIGSPGINYVLLLLPSDEKEVMTYVGEGVGVHRQWSVKMDGKVYPGLYTEMLSTSC